MSKIKVTGFLSVFESRLEKLIGKIKDEYKKPKSERDKSNLKALAKEGKQLKKLVEEMREETAPKCKCPACGHTFKLK